MRKSVLITTDHPTVEEVARRLGVSRKRTKELVHMAEANVARHSSERDPTPMASKKKGGADRKRGGKPSQGE